MRCCFLSGRAHWRPRPPAGPPGLPACQSCSWGSVLHPQSLQWVPSRQRCLLTWGFRTGPLSPAVEGSERTRPRRQCFLLSPRGSHPGLCTSCYTRTPTAAAPLLLPGWGTENPLLSTGPGHALAPPTLTKPRQPVRAAHLSSGLPPARTPGITQTLFLSQPSLLPSRAPLLFFFFLPPGH